MKFGEHKKCHDTRVLWQLIKQLSKNNKKEFVRTKARKGLLPIRSYATCEKDICYFSTICTSNK